MKSTTTNEIDNDELLCPGCQYPLGNIERSPTCRDCEISFDDDPITLATYDRLMSNKPCCTICAVTFTSDTPIYMGKEQLATNNFICITCGETRERTVTEWKR